MSLFVFFVSLKMLGGFCFIIRFPVIACSKTPFQQTHTLHRQFGPKTIVCCNNNKGVMVSPKEAEQDGSVDLAI